MDDKDYDLVIDSNYYNQQRGIFSRFFYKDLEKHFNKIGWKKNLNPNNYFNTKIYLERYEDVKKSGINPFEHYKKYGKVEGRNAAKSLFENIDIDIEILFKEFENFTLITRDEATKINFKTSRNIKLRQLPARYYESKVQVKILFELLKKITNDYENLNLLCCCDFYHYKQSIVNLEKDYFLIICHRSCTCKLTNLGKFKDDNFNLDFLEINKFSYTDLDFILSNLCIYLPSKKIYLSYCTLLEKIYSDNNLEFYTNIDFINLKHEKR